MFVFGNALWDKLVEIFGSTDAVVEATVTLIVAGLIVYYFRQIIAVIVIIIALILIFS
jgi:hypothetical protein